MHYTYENVTWMTQPGGSRRARVDLAEGDTAWMPGSTKRVFYGPLLVTYTEHPDGGVDATAADR